MIRLRTIQKWMQTYKMCFAIYSRPGRIISNDVFNLFSRNVYKLFLWNISLKQISSFDSLRQQVILPEVLTDSGTSRIALVSILYAFLIWWLPTEEGRFPAQSIIAKESALTSLAFLLGDRNVHCFYKCISVASEDKTLCDWMFELLFLREGPSLVFSR